MRAAAQSTVQAAARAAEKRPPHQGLLLPVALAVALLATGVFAALALVAGSDLDEARRDLSVQEAKTARAAADLEAAHAELEQTEAALADSQAKLQAAQRGAQVDQATAARRQQVTADTRVCTDGVRLASQLIAQNNWPAAQAELTRVQPFCDRAAQESAALG